MSMHALALPNRIYRPVTAEDLPQLHRFISQQIDANGMLGTRDESYYRWKFFSQPRSFCFGAFVDGSLVGFLGRMCRPFVLEGQQHTITEGTDAFVARRYQGTGLFQRLVVTARRAVVQAGVAFSSARPNRNSQPGALRAGHRRLCDLELHTRPMSGHYVAGRLTNSASLQKLLRHAAAASLRITGLPLRASRLAGIRLEQIDRFDERMDQLWRAARPRFDAGVVHDRRYMNWRYVECPSEYHCFSLVRGDQLQGVAVAKRVAATDEEPVSAEIVDLVTIAPDRGALAYLLVGQAMRALSTSGAEVIRCLLPRQSRPNDDPLRVSLRLHGFVRRPAADTALLVRPEANARAVEQLVRHGSWRFRAGDIDSA